MILIIFLGLDHLYGREIKVTVTDTALEIPLEGVRIKIIGEDNSIFTDAEGKTKLIIPEDLDRLLISAELIGYEPKRINIREISDSISIGMSIEGVIEGKELVIEKEQIGRTDAEIGVSTVIGENELKATAMIGAVEDVMSAIKTLPGVSYGGRFSLTLSVRGGHPDELSCVYDGFLIRFPWHWGGAFSIFNPNIVESVKFSTGIFSVKNGLAMSGLIEVESFKPDNGLRVETHFGTQTAEAFIQLPIGKQKKHKSGIFTGARITYNDLTMLIVKPVLENNGIEYSQAPYIRDGYLKWFWKPHKRVEWYLNGFFGSDGIAMVFD
ncbi:MAG: TonB-dependent receptor plug domain-containing protein, partial [Actinomycetia bacterium]|nr:TonB-dependent receptor plug domain-containing protein [Actinomycetes bacterium]